MAGRLFRGGVPTDPEVKALMALGAAPGDEVTYERVEQIIGAGRYDRRFDAVTSAWRRRVFREHRLRIKRSGGVFRFLTAAEGLTESAADMHRVGRAAGRCTVHVEAIDAGALDDVGLQRHALLRRNADALLNAAREANKAIALPKPISAAEPPLRLAARTD